MDIDLFSQLQELISPHGILRSSGSLIYRASRDGFKSIAFHSKCCGIKNTLTLVKARSGNIFGGFTTKKCEGFSSYDNGIYRQDKKAFVFSLVNRTKKPHKFNIKEEEFKQAVYDDGSLGPTFGKGHDFSISSNSNLNEKSYSQLGCSYKVPSFITENEPNSFLAGSEHFNVAEIEVFSVHLDIGNDRSLDLIRDIDAIVPTYP